MPIFIGGTGRSGTSHLSKILGEYPSIWSLKQECRFIIDPGGIEDIVHAFIMTQPPGVNAGPRGIEVLPRKRIVVGNLKPDGTHIRGQFGDRLGPDTAQIALHGNILEDGGLERGVAGSLAKAERGAVQRVAPIQPSARAVYMDLVEIVVSMPFQPLGRQAEFPGEFVHQLGNASRELDARITEPEAHRVA